MALQAIQEPPVAESELRAIERMAVELANLAGAEIVTALGGMMSVRYKTESADETLLRDPVSEIDHRVESLIRTRLADRFPEHDIIGEEMDERPGRDHDFVWVIDPIDGTANFVNGFPMFAASIGVLHRGHPIVGALWCSTSHRLRAGVYHACVGSELLFDGNYSMPKANPAVRRWLAGVPDTNIKSFWDTRKTGSAAIECALVASGLLRVAMFRSPNVWDVAGGIALVAATGGEVRMQTADGWVPMTSFEPLSTPRRPTPDLRNWRRSLIMGEPQSVELMCKEFRDDEGAPAF